MLLLNNCFYQLWLCIFWCVLASIAFFAKVLACYRCRRFLWAVSDYFDFSGIPSVLSGEMYKWVWWDELYYVGKEEFELLLSTFLLFWLLEHWVFFRCFRLVSFFLIALWSDIRTSPRCNRDSFYLWTFPRWFYLLFLHQCSHNCWWCFFLASSLPMPGGIVSVGIISWTLRASFCC